MSMPIEQLRRTLEKTGFRASLAEEYMAGHAPGTLRKHGHVTPDQPTYYGRPAIKKPEWLWYVPAYLFVGGVSSGAYIVSTLLDMRGRTEDRPLVRAGRYLALAGMLVSPILLIADLGRPERFLNMLRVFKPRSMMSMGSWGLTLFGLFSGLAVVAQTLQDFGMRMPAFRRVALPVRVVSWLGMLPAMFVGSYTGLLLSATNVPLWAGNRLLMGPLFFSSAMSTGLATTSLVARLLGPISPRSRERLKRAERVVLFAELGLTVGSGVALGRQARPLLVGRWARIYQLGSIGAGMLLPMALDRPTAKSRLADLLASALVLAGGAMMRLAVTEAGKQSADDPRAHLEYTSPGERG
jgi:formate-dependent nitrite reductase membrane component NrfD